MSAKRIAVAGVVDRLPQGSLQEAPKQESAPMYTPKRLGRPPKPAGTKAVPITVMLWPDELERLEQLRAAVNEGLPAEVQRAALARLAFSRLLEMTPEQIRKALAAARRK